MLAHITSEELNSVLDTVVVELLAVGEISTPPVDAFKIARRLGIIVAWDDDQPGRARIVRLACDAVWSESRAQTSILLRHEPRSEREQWSVAHELGEHEAQKVFRRLGVAPSETAPAMREQCANWIANRLLLPSDWFGTLGARVDWDLRRLKPYFSTASHELIARRMLELGPPCIVSVVDQGRLTWRRASVPRLLADWSAIEKSCWLRAHHNQCDIHRLMEARRVRVWPIHEPNWKREIVRLDWISDDECFHHSNDSPTSQ